MRYWYRYQVRKKVFTTKLLVPSRKRNLWALLLKICEPVSASETVNHSQATYKTSTLLDKASKASLYRNIRILIKISFSTYLGKRRTAAQANMACPVSALPATMQPRYTKKEKEKAMSRPFHMLAVNTWHQRVWVRCSMTRECARRLTCPAVFENRCDFI